MMPTAELIGATKAVSGATKAHESCLTHQRNQHQRTARFLIQSSCSRRIQRYMFFSVQAELAIAFFMFLRVICSLFLAIFPTAHFFRLRLDAGLSASISEISSCIPAILVLDLLRGRERGLHPVISWHMLGRGFPGSYRHLILGLERKGSHFYLPTWYWFSIRFSDFSESSCLRANSCFRWYYRHNFLKIST